MAMRVAAGTSAGALVHWQSKGQSATHEALKAAYPNAREFEVYDGAAQFTCSILRLAGLTIHRTHTNGYGCRAEPNDAVRLTLPARGRVTMTSGRRETIAMAGESGLVCLREAIDRKVGTDYFGYHFQIPKADVLSAARILTGEQHEEHEIESSVDLKAPTGASLLRSIAALFTEAERLADVGLGQLAAASASDLVVNLATAAVLPRVRSRLWRPRDAGGRSAVEQARQFIDAHAAEPIRLGVLADDLGLSLRALQSSFRKRFGCTPSDYLFRRRLELARELLLTAGDATTVTAVAIDCGFVNVGAFAARYYRAFGERPSQTLNNVRGRAPQRQFAARHNSPSVHETWLC